MMVAPKILSDYLNDMLAVEREIHQAFSRQQRDEQVKRFPAVAVLIGSVEETIDRYRPRVAIVNAGGASFLEGGLIVMGIDDVREVASRVPVVVCVHMEALNHCHLSRADLAAAVPGVVIPRDGETVEV